MAIKAIIHNTEKEIEQIKNSDEQDIDYVYSRIGDTEVEGEPPISIKSIGGSLADYRIYGNTVGGESVGDLVESGEHSGEYKVDVTVEGENLYEITKFDDDCVSKTIYGITFTISNNKVIYSGTATSTYPQVLSPELPLIPGQSYYAKIIVKGSYEGQAYIFFRGSQVEGGTKQNYKQIIYGTEEVFTAWYNTSVLYVAQGNNRHFDVSVEVVITKVPSVITTIYLPEQIKKVGDDAEYIDYADQKLHRIGAEDIDVTLPALPTITGTNVLTVGTAVQPSNIYIKDNFDYERVFTATRTIEDELPFNYRSIEDNDSILSNYRIYGQTVNGESVGDRTGNLCNIIASNGKIKDELYLIVNDDKSITLNGYANSTAVIHISDFISAGNYYIKGCPSEGSSSSFQIVARDRNNSTIVAESGDGVQINATSDFDICIRIAANYNCDGLTFFPIVSLSESSYEPYGYKVPVTIEGKNLLSIIATSREINGVTFTVNSDGSVTCDGTASTQAQISLITNMHMGSGEYILSGCPIGGSASTYELSIFGVSNYYSSGIRNRGNSVKFSFPLAVQSASVSITIRTGYTCDNLTFYPMIRKADIEDDTYEPYHAPVTIPIYLPEPIKMVGDEAEYIDYAEQKQHRVRKNLLENKAISKTLNSGITMTVNDNKSVVVNGTSNTGNASGIILGGDVILDKGAYILSGCPQGGSNDTYKLYCIFDDDGERKVMADIGDGATIVLNGDNPKIIKDGFYIYALSCNNNVFYPMLRKAGIEDDTYEPYIENTEVDVTLPTLPVMPGTNVMSVNTEVQPSKVEIKGHIK